MDKKLCAELDALGHQHWFHEDSRRLIVSYLLAAMKIGARRAERAVCDSCSYEDGDFYSMKIEEVVREFTEKDLACEHQ